MRHPVPVAQETWLGTGLDLSYGADVISFLRFVGVMNAAVWLGGSAFHLFAAAPFFGSEAVRWLLGDLHASGTGLMLWQRFYLLQYLCMGIAWLHLLAEWVYLGRGVSRFNGWVLSAILCIAVTSHAEMSLAVEKAHWNRRNARVTAEERDRAARVYPLWSGVWTATNAVLGLAVLAFSWRTLTASHGPRFMTQTRFRTPDSMEA